MADQPQNPQNPNSGRISSMLQDLAAQRSDARPAPIVVGGPPPVNLPTAPVRVPVPAAVVPQRPPVTPQSVAPPVAPMAPKPTVPTPPTPTQPVGAALPSRPTPPPAPREIAATVPPKPAIPPPPPPQIRPTPPAVPQPSATPAPAVPAVTSELRTMSSDIGRIQVGQPPAGVPPAGVSPASPASGPVPSAPAAVPQISGTPPVIILQTPSGGGGKKVLFIGLGLLVLTIVAVTVWSFFGGNGQIAEETPTPSATPTLTTTPQGKNLSSYFGLPKATATITSTETSVTDLRNALLTAEPAAKQGMSMAVLRSGSPMTPGAFLAATMGVVPVDVGGSFGTDWVALAYGQTEAFDGAGQPLTDSVAQPTLALVVEVADASKVNQAMQAWEGTTLDTSAEKLFGYIRDNAIVTGFNSGTYREIPIRFRNFPYAHESLDWAMILASNGKNYLVLTGSRESIFFVVDQLMQ